MYTYQKRPVKIEAFRLGHEKPPAWFTEALYSNPPVIHDYYEGAGCIIETLEGPMQAWEGDYIIKGVEGELYSCKNNIFHKSYIAI